MKRIASSLLLALPLLGADYKIDPAHSLASFSVKHMMVTNVRGQFSNVSGTISYDPANLATAKVNATIDVTTIDTSQPKRDEHLKSPDFLDAAKFPAITFASKKFWKEGDTVKALGNLTIHGVTREVVLTLETPSPERRTQNGYVVGTTATTVISRKDYGLTWNQALEAGGVAVGDEVKITIDIEANRS